METKGLKQLLEIFWAFFKIGPITFGGGYAVIPVIERDMVENRKWVTRDEIADVLVLAGTLPGAVAINSATFIGYKLANVRGAITALTGIFLPTFLVVLLLSAAFIQFQDNALVQGAFQAIKVTVVALIAYAGYRMAQSAIFDKTTLAVTAAALILLLVFSVHPVAVILSSIPLSIAYVTIRRRLGKRTRLAKHEPKVEKGEN